MARTLTTLTGSLGQDREVRYTRERTSLQTVYNPIAEMDEVREVTIPAREYLQFSLACHDRGKTSWHQLVIWNPDERGFWNGRLGRKAPRSTCGARCAMLSSQLHWLCLAPCEHRQPRPGACNTEAYLYRARLPHSTRLSARMMLVSATVRISTDSSDRRH